MRLCVKERKRERERERWGKGLITLTVFVATAVVAFFDARSFFLSIDGVTS